MPRTPNPLLEMAQVLEVDVTGEIRPDESFAETALPGFKQALHARRSLRAYDGEPVPEEIMRDCLRDAILAPNSSNLQVYQLVWVRDSQKKRQLSDFCLGQPAAATAGELVVVVARGDRWRANRDKLVDLMTKGGTRPLPEPLDEYYNSIIPRLMSTDRFGLFNLTRRIYYWFNGRHQPSMRTPVNRGDHRLYAHVQAALAAETLMLSLSAHGFDSCPMGGMDAVRIHRMLDLPKGAEVCMVVAAGRGTPEGLYGPRLRLPDADLIKEA